MKIKFVSFLPAVTWFIFTIVLLTLPGSDIPQSSFFDLIFFDKWVHIGMFAILVILAGIPLLKAISASWQLFLKIALAAISYGVAMEFVQKFIATDRSFDIWDMAADAAGSFIGYFFLLTRHKKTLKAKISK